MLCSRFLNGIPKLPNNVIRSTWCSKRYFNQKKLPEEDTEKPNVSLGDVGSKYKVFRDEDSPEVIDVVEERLKYTRMQVEEVEDAYAGLNLERGKTGVFDIEDLVEVLKRENASDLFVATIPPTCKYVDYLCVVSANSKRHMNAIAQFVKRVYKHKRKQSDIVPSIEGVDSSDWMALDLGNIALHIFSKQARKVYDIDSLWSIGAEYDKETNKKDAIVEMLEKHSFYLKDLQPAR